MNDENIMSEQEMSDLLEMSKKQAMEDLLGRLQLKYGDKPTNHELFKFIQNEE